jgi:hypothetical protein
LKRALNGAQVGVDRSAFAIETQFIVAQRRDEEGRKSIMEAFQYQALDAAVVARLCPLESSLFGL